jgi:tetratricopeptide (TPR) repeat protein
LGAFQGVLELRREGLALYERLARENPNRLEDMSGLALAHNRMASILMHEKDMRGALHHYREHLRLQQEVHRRFGATAERAANIALAHSNLGNALRAAGQFREALEEYDKAGALYRPLVEADPNEVRNRTLLATLRARLARTWIEMGQAEQALPALRMVLEERRLLAERNPANAGALGEVAETHGVIGDAYAAMRQGAAAEAAYGEAVKILESLRAERRFNAANKEELDRIQARLSTLQHAGGGNAAGRTAVGR